MRQSCQVDAAGRLGWNRRSRVIPRPRPEAVYQVREEGDDHTGEEADQVGGVSEGNARIHRKEEVEDHDADGCPVQRHALLGFVNAFHPDIAEEGENDAGHAAEEWPARVVELAEVGSEGGDEHEDGEIAEDLRLNSTSEPRAQQLVHIKGEVKDAEVDEDGGRAARLSAFEVVEQVAADEAVGVSTEPGESGRTRRSVVTSSCSRAAIDEPLILAEDRERR